MRQASFSCGGPLEQRGERLAPPELVLVHPDGEPEARRERVVLGVDVLAPEPVALLEPERVEAPETGGDEPVIAAGPPQQLPGAVPHRELPVELPPELTGVGDPLRPDRTDLAEVQVPRGHVRERVVRDVHVGYGLEDRPRVRPPQAEREQRPRPLGDRDALAVAEVPPEPGEVVLAAPAAGHHAEQLVVLARDREVEADAAARRERRRVDDRPEGPVDPVGANTRSRNASASGPARRTSRTP